MLTQISQPIADMIGLVEVKQALGVIGDADDALLERLIESATAAFDGPEGLLGRCLVQQTWKYEIAAFPIGNIRLPLPPVIAVSSISYRHADGSEVALDVSEFSVMGIGSMDACVIVPKTRWPSSHHVAITFDAGFGESGALVPEDIRGAIFQSISAQYGWRESSILATSSVHANPEFDTVLDRWRTRGFGG